jgi:hypothetical protein
MLDVIVYVCVGAIICFLWLRSRTFCLRIMFRDLSRSVCIG